MKKIIDKIKENVLINNFIYGIGSKMVAMIFYMITDILVVHYLTYQMYGEWTYYYSIATILFVFCRLGINSSTLVHVASGETLEEQKKYFFAGLFVRLTVSLSLGFILFLIMPNIAFLLGFPEKYVELKDMFYILPVLIFGNSMVDFFKNTYISTEEFKKFFVLTVWEYLGIFISGASIIILKSSIKALNMVYSISYLFVAVCGYIMLRAEWKRFNLKEIFNESEKIIKIVRYSLPAFCTGMIGILLMEMDTFMLGLMSTPGESGIYSIGKSLLTKATNLSVAMSSSTMTSFARVTRENIERKKTQFKRLNKVNFFAVLGMCACCVTLGRFVIVFLYGEKYMKAVLVIYALLPYYLLLSMSFFPETYLNYQHLASKCLRYNIVMFISNLILNLLLIPRYGALGAVLATDMAVFPYVVLLYNATYRDLKEKTMYKV